MADDRHSRLPITGEQGLAAAIAIAIGIAIAIAIGIASERMDRACARLVTQLAGHAWAAGERFTVADGGCALAVPRRLDAPDPRMRLRCCVGPAAPLGSARTRVQPVRCHTDTGGIGAYAAVHTMSSRPPDPGHPSRLLNALDAALDQSQDVKAKVEACAEELGSANVLAETEIARGATTMPAAQALQNGLVVESQVQDIADDLQQVTNNLAHGVAEVRAVERALAQSRRALAESGAALAASRSAEHIASQLAMHDRKTGLPNRTLFDDRLAQAIAGAERHGWTLAVMFLDLDRFKLVNDTHGHAAGDTVLKVVAQRLLRHARDEDTVCRNGGDEFLYLLINPVDRNAVARIAGLVRKAIEAPIGLGALQFAITPSIGIALYPDHGLSGPTLIARADAAMYRAKQSLSPCEFFEPSMAAGGGGSEAPDSA